MKKKTEKPYVKPIYIYCEMLHKISAGIIIEKLKKHQELDSSDLNVILILLEYFVRGNDEE